MISGVRIIEEKLKCCSETTTMPYTIMVDSAGGSCMLFLLSKVILFFYEDDEFLIDLKLEKTPSSGEQDKISGRAVSQHILSERSQKYW